VHWGHQGNAKVVVVIMIPGNMLTTIVEMMGEEIMAIVQSNNNSNDLSMELRLTVCATQLPIIIINATTTTGHSINHLIIGEGEEEDRITDRR